MMLTVIFDATNKLILKTHKASKEIQRSFSGGRITSDFKSSKTMWLKVLLLPLPFLLLTRAQNACLGHPTFRSPSNADIQVTCGSQSVELQILLCPVYFNGYNESLLSLNSQHSKPECKGTADWTVDPPVVKFNLSITEEGISRCGNKMIMTEEVGTGAFTDFSSVQYITISGMLCTKDPSNAAITYHEEVMYFFSCRYPLQYLVNNTEMGVAGVSLAVKDNNGSFVSTLSMNLFSENSFSSVLLIPPAGLELKTRIYVEVKASNLTNRFNVLLDRCYATASPFPVNATSYDLFVGCSQDGQTVMGVNGEEQMARFSFEAFRFIHQTDATLATYYLHCVTRLCLSSICHSLTPNCSGNARGRRAVRDDEGTAVSDVATVSSGPITTRLHSGNPAAPAGEPQTRADGTTLAGAVIGAMVGAVCLTSLGFVAYNIYKSNKAPGRSILTP
ncbi:zona pellucida-like domain-containing protein 1 [Neosynchiropus ocellatus]